MTSTPPHHPTYNVGFSPEQISHIIAQIAPSKKVFAIQQLESGRSFNNRIYYIKLCASESSSGPGAEEDVVLKLSGQFYKVQNEVACLALIEQHCALIPVPRVIAWSEGRDAWSQVHVVDRLQACGATIKSTRLKLDESMIGTHQHHGWILLTRLPGRQLELSDLASNETAQLAEDLAFMVAQFRRNIPLQGCFGNIRLEDTPTTSGDAATEDMPQRVEWTLKVGGLVSRPQVPTTPVKTALAYYRIKLQDQLRKLENEDVFTPLRKKVLIMVKDFVSESLPDLQLFRQTTQEQPTFTQYDFAPRNVLVAGSPIRVTGLVDFEWAGFFSPEEEFANDAVENEGDWPSHVYERFLSKLVELGVETPLRGFSARRWDEARLLMELILAVAPWQLQGGMEENALQAECQKAADTIRRCVGQLQRSC